MAEKDTQFKEKIKQSGTFDFKDLYSFAYEWLDGEGYNVAEKKYAEEVSGDSKKIEIEWETKKKVSDYFQFVIKVDWKMLNLKNVEVIREGKKIKLNSGQAEIKVSGVLVKDYESRWEDRPIWKFLRGVYDRYIIRSRIDEYEDKITSQADDFVNQLKAYLAIEGKR